MLMVYEPADKRIDIERIRQTMDISGFPVSKIHPNPQVGAECIIEIYYESDIPFPYTYANYMIREQKLNVDVKCLQEIQNEDGAWINVDTTMSSICEAEGCESPSNQSAIITKANEQRVVYSLCEYHAHLVSKKINFNVSKKIDEP